MGSRNDGAEHQNWQNKDDQLQNPGNSLVNISQRSVEKVQNFQYLGSIISSEGGTEQDIGKAKAPFGMLSSVLEKQLF